MLQSSVISPLISHILDTFFSVVLIIKLYVSEASEPKLCELEIRGHFGNSSLVLPVP